MDSFSVYKSWSELNRTLTDIYKEAEENEGVLDESLQERLAAYVNDEVNAINDLQDLRDEAQGSVASLKFQISLLQRKIEIKNNLDAVLKQMIYETTRRKGGKFDTGRYKFSISTSKSINESMIDDIPNQFKYISLEGKLNIDAFEKLAKEYESIKGETTIDKNALKAAIKADKTLEKFIIEKPSLTKR